MLIKDTINSKKKPTPNLSSPKQVLYSLAKNAFTWLPADMPAYPSAQLCIFLFTENKFGVNKKVILLLSCRNLTKPTEVNKNANCLQNKVFGILESICYCHMYLHSFALCSCEDNFRNSSTSTWHNLASTTHVDCCQRNCKKVLFFCKKSKALKNILHTFHLLTNTCQCQLATFIHTKKWKKICNKMITIYCCMLSVCV